MSKAEQKSIEWQKANHPMAIGGGNFADVVDAYNVNPAFAAGYKEAEKELALTWEDIKMIFTIAYNYDGEFNRPHFGSDAYYKEVLRRFNAKRNEKEI